MSKKIPDEKFDAFMKDLLSMSAVDDDTVNEIAESPTVWWAVQKRIAEQKAASRSPWPPIAKFWRILLIGVPAAAVAILLITIFVFRPAVSKTDRAGLQENVSTDTANEPPREIDRAVLPTNSETSTKPAEVGPRIVSARKTVADKAVHALKYGKVETASKPVHAEIKTEFIALTYARDPESGQIVRVKVPSSMMVTLGLVSTVEKPSTLVDAEVIVGDDGLTRAIRFIR